VLPTRIFRAFSAPLVEVQSQVLRQDVRLVGSTFRLHYRSDRVRGRRLAATIDIPLSGKSLPRRTKELVLELEVAGRRITERFEPKADQKYTFHWDGSDASGKEAVTPQPLTIRIGRVQRAFYPRPELTRWHERVTGIGPIDARVIGLGGWMLTPHAVLDRLRNVVYLGDGRRSRAVRADAPPSEVHVRSRDGSETFVFDAAGRHSRTIDAFWGTTRFRFEYDAAGWLTAVTNADGGVTRIERPSGTQAVIITPGGQRTTLTLNTDGYLTGITNPAGHTVRLDYLRGGLLQSLTDPNGNTYQFSYDDEGRVARRDEPGGTFSSYASRRSDGAVSVAAITALGHESIYERETLSSGGEHRRNTCCGGRAIDVRVARDGSRHASYPDGSSSQIRREDGAEIREIRTPSGLTRRMTRRHTESADGDTTIFEINGRVHTSKRDRVRRETISRSADGIEIIQRYDERGRLVENKAGGREPVKYEYDGAGRLGKIRFGSGQDGRVTTMRHDRDGRLIEIADPLQGVSRMKYDAAGMLVGLILPAGTSVAYGHDANGNRISIAPPERPAHTFRRNPLNLITAYEPPPAGGSAATRFAYDAENRPSQTILPDGTRIEFRYDAAGQIAQVQLPDASVQLSTDRKTGYLGSVVTDQTTVNYAYDGFLLTGIAWDGAVKGEVSRKYDNDFRIAALSVNGQEIVREYSGDGRLLRVGELTIRRDGSTGRVSETILGSIRTTETYNRFGELESIRAKGATGELFSLTLRRDAMGRISEKDETIEGEHHVYSYEYDAAGCLSAVRGDGQRTVAFQYDANGNRLALITSSGRRDAEFDALDRILSDGAVSFHHTPNGQRAAKTVEGKTTKYRYDGLGNLMGVTLSDGRAIDYVLDGQARRLVKRVNGERIQAFLYRDLLSPIAELGRDNEVLSRFVFGERKHVLAYIVKGGVVYRVLTDHLGSPRLIVNANDGAVVQRLDYDEFGNVVRDTNPNFQPFAFAGGVYDADTKLLHFGAREYDPQTGRWTRPDPALFGGGDTNLYAYVFNDPVNLTDPIGLWRGILPGWGPDWHHNRNAGQNCPPSPPDLFKGPEDCPIPTGWSHEGHTPTHGGYDSYRHEYGWQCVYTDQGGLVNNPEYDGSFDHSPPYNPDGSVSPGGVVEHIIVDVLPWIIFGN
jgi:RHS repeat-associated protein